MQKQQRRMTAPAGSLQPPEGSYHQPTANRPSSPLRNGFLPNSTSTGIDPHFEHDEEHEDWRSPSPASSVSHVSQMAASFVRSMMDAVAPKTPGVPEDEQEAERERDRSRREAERILTREAEDRRLEERVLAMMESTKALPPPPSRTQSMDPPSPSGSQKEGGWWTAAKNRLTPNKDLTPAQQVIQEAKAREKENKKNAKGKEKEWAKYNNPSYSSLVPPPSRSQAPSPSSPSTPSPSPSRPQNSNMPPNLTPSPMRADPSKEKEAPPLYAHFDETTGTLDVHVTLLTIAKRFEKLEKWTVGHVRALEERMGDVERWLVDKENDKESHKTPNEDGEGLAEIREGLHELQSRVSSLGREMAKFAVTPANLSQPTKARYPAEISASPNTPSSSFAIPGTSPRTVSGHTALDSTSPPMRSNSTSSTRLPYPTGDYTSPTQSALPSRDVFTASPTTESHSISGLPSTAPPLSTSTSYSNASFSSVSSLSMKASELPVPKPPSRSGRGSVSPTPRKRYTVALGGADSDSDSNVEMGTATFSGSDGEEFGGGDTIGKSAAAKLAQKASTPLKEPRVRAQSAYGLSSILHASPNTVSSLAERRPSPIPHGRSKSIDRFGTGNNFVDPLVLRKQTSNVGKDGTIKPLSGKPVAQMVAFFDGDRK
ncbi:hypothetical protein MIND_00742000 [Mycena indigotica]|uniref:Uncharacterized protein n=1 Tax=Mycena indigotica TaxID=2126181 RepID=A0A8H6W753_9AGAR|nr:uncharacterized protein MIND_00742000 [Mycena indigotica]KAF7301764.1 hypothetical protein MIND_00742000 [Mycena indigotica]